MRVAGWRKWTDFHDRHLPSAAFTRPRLSSSWPCVAAAALALLATTAWALQHDGSIEIAGHARTIDGDTIAFGRMHVRLYGIAAPESDQTCSNTAGDVYPCAVLATSALLQLVDGENIICHADAWNLNRRLLATCWRGDLDLGREMVREGHATAYRHFSTIYVAAEDEARAARRGIWRAALVEPTPGGRRTRASKGTTTSAKRS
jgi:endonuclease YncB( thermonuclease family)